MIFVLGDGVAGDASRSLARGLGRIGELVALGALDPGAPDSEDVVTVPCAMTSGDEVADVLRRAGGTGEPVHAVVLVSAGSAASDQGELTTLDPSQWEERVELPLRRTLACFQGSYRCLREHGGCLIVLVPTMALVGAAGFAPWSAVAEAQRALVKSAGRAWGAEAVTVNCVAVPGALLSSAARPASDRPGLPPPSLERSHDMETDVAPVVASLASRGWTGVTGATIAVDGGVWMTP